LLIAQPEGTEGASPGAVVSIWLTDALPLDAFPSASAA
jgi:hypothetical protein